MECPTGSGRLLNLREVAAELAARLARIFRPTSRAGASVTARSRFAEDPHWRELVLFHEYFHGDSGKGLGASHQTGWTAVNHAAAPGLLRLEGFCRRPGCLAAGRRGGRGRFA